MPIQVFEPAVVESILTWMEGSALAQFVVANAWVFPTLETLHFLGLIILIGSLFVIDLRLLGLAAHIPLDAAMAFLPWAILGFGINLTTGTMFVFSDPFRYYPNLSFRLKMLAIVLSGLNALWFKFMVYPQIGNAPDQNLPASAKWVAAFSILLWLTVIVFGRLIPYLE